MRIKKVKSTTNQLKEDLHGYDLTSSQRRRNREEVIRNYILAAPGGICSVKELVAALQLDTNTHTTEYYRGIDIIRRMLRRGFISHNQTKSFRKTWVVVPKAKRKYVRKQTVIVQEIAQSTTDKVTFDLEQLEQMAKDFTWQQGSDSLRLFITTAPNLVGTTRD